MKPHLYMLMALMLGTALVPAAAQAATTLRIEAGGTANVTAESVTWVADKYFNGGSVVDRGAVAIANTTSDRLYQTERYNLTGYAIPVTNGTYNVKLHFAETYTGTTVIGQRVFGVAVEGKAVGNIDVFKETGGLNKALVKTVTGVNVGDGTLNIAFTKISGAPMISAIEVLPGVTPTNGACGAANGVAVAAKPTTNLCAAGTASAVAGTGPWTWTCAGLSGGTTASCSAPKLAPTTGARGRPHASKGTVLSDKGTLLRGTTFAIRTSGGDVITNAFWKHLHEDLKLNALRLGVQTGYVGRTVGEQLPWIDQAVDLAEKNHMYIMIMNSRKSGTYDAAELKAFWSVVAPRYKNRTHVFYELTNEAVKGSPWGHASEYTDKVLADLKSVYNVIRSGAPNTLIAWIDTANLSPDEPTYSAMLRRIPGGADWSNAAIAFHSYTGTYKFGEDNLRAMKAKYPLIMTETNYWNDDVRDKPYQRRILLMYEKLGISWFSLGGNGGYEHLENEILPMLHENGYNWTME